MKTEWAHKKLIDLADYYNGMAFKPSDWVESGTKIIRIEQLNNPLGNYDYYQGSYPEINAIHNEDLIFSWSATLKVAIWKWGEGVLNQHLFKVVPFENVDKYFLYYLLDYNMPKLGESSHGSTMKHIKRKELETYSVKIPTTLSAQRRIAAILASADKVIAATQKTIAKYKQMKQGMMEDLLKPKDGWKMVKLGEVGEIVTGSTPTTTKAEYWDGEYNFYSPVDFGENVYCTKTDRTITAAGMKTGRPVPANSIMVACIASIGKIAINRTEGITNQQINTIIPNDDYNFIFLYYLLSLNVEKIKGKAAQTTIPIINKEDFSNLEFSVPVLAEQRRIAAILSGIDAKIAAEEKVLEKYEKVKKGLMERLLDGDGKDN